MCLIRLIFYGFVFVTFNFLNNYAARYCKNISVDLKIANRDSGWGIYKLVHAIMSYY